MNKVAQWLGLFRGCTEDPTPSFRELSGDELTAVFGGGYPLIPLKDEDPDLKPERVQGW